MASEQAELLEMANDDIATWRTKFDALNAEYTKLLNVLAAVVTGQVKHEWVAIDMLERAWRVDIPASVEAAEVTTTTTED